MFSQKAIERVKLIDKKINFVNAIISEKGSVLKALEDEQNSRASILMHLTLNIFIKNSLNEDYMLGHSYFMKVNSDDDLEFVKEYKIKPLLEEYFYADDENYKKAIGVLNKYD